MSRAFRSLFILALAWAGLALAADAEASGKILRLDFTELGGAGRLDIVADKPLAFERRDDPGKKQVVLDFKSATIDSVINRPMDTTSFAGPFALISPYPLDGGGVRLVIQLRDWRPLALDQSGTLIRVSGSNETQAGLPDVPTAPAQEIPPPPMMEHPPHPEALAAPAAPPEAAPTPEEVQSKKLEEFIEARKAKQYIGSRITLNLRDTPVVDALRLISDSSGFNIVVGEGVGGNLNLNLVDVPWDQALDVILQTRGLGAERNGNVLRVMTLPSLAREKQEELTARRAQEAAAPRVTKVFPINYADPGSIQRVIQEFGSRSESGVPVRTHYDQRTNSIIVQDTVENVERVKKLLEVLDTQIPQILVESKIVEASEGFTKSIGGGIGGRMENSQNSTSPFGFGFNGQYPSTNLFSSPNAIVAQGSSTGTSAFAWAPNVAFFPGLRNVEARLSILESENQAKIISSPRLVVLNRETARLLQSQPTGVTVTTTADGVTTQSTAITQANVSLSVTPVVTNEGSVFMDLNISRDVPTAISGGTAVSQRNINTRVLVDSGSTLVIGGVYSSDRTKTESGMPGLRKIPIIGALFGNKSDSENRSELFIFISPRILNPKESGLENG